MDNKPLIRLKELRKKENISLQTLSSLVDISFSSLSAYERGTRKPKYEQLEKLANYFHVDIAYLSGETNIPNLSQYIIKNSNSDIQISRTMDDPNSISDIQEQLIKSNLEKIVYPALKAIYGKDAKTLNNELTNFDNRVTYGEFIKIASNAALNSQLFASNDENALYGLALLGEVISTFDNDIYNGAVHNETFNMKDFQTEVNNIFEFYLDSKNYHPENNSDNN